MSPRDSMVRRTRWDSVADPARLVEYVPTGAVTYMIPSRNRRELPGPDSRPAEEKAKAIFELMAKLGIRYVLEPADSRPGAQFVRPVEEVFRASGQGTCLDLCVAFSSAALDAGLHPMILTVTKSNTGNKSDKKCHSIVLIPCNRTWSASGRPEPVADHEVVHEPFLLDDMPLKAMVYRTATGSGDLLAIDMQQASRKPDGTPFGDWESAVSRGADFLTGTTGWDWDVCVDIGALRGTMVAPHSVYAPPRTRVLEPGYLKPAPGATRSPLQLIKARTGIVPFTGRDKLTELTDWANKQPGEGREDLAVAVVTGVGGSGKTRLAAELCSKLEKTGWVAGFVPKTTELSEAELIWLTRVESHLLLVLDYAEESHKEELTRLLRRLRERGAPTRVVLTARSAGAWLDDLLKDDVLSGAMAQGLRRFELPRQAETSTKMAKRAAKRFARYLETPEPVDVEIPQNSRWTTLDFVLHGWLIASEVDAANLPSSRERLYEDILRREIKYWQDEAARQGMAKVSEATLRTSAAVLSLIGPRTVSETADVLSRLPEWSEVELRKTYAELLSKMLADPGDAYVLRPDPVAEKLIVEVFVDDGETIDDPEELLNKVLPPDPLSDSRLNEATCPPAIARRALCHGRQSQQVCDVITRCTSQGDAPAAQLAHSALRCRTHLWISGLEAALKQGGPFVTALEEALKDGMNIPAAEIADSIPSRHSYLRGLAVTAMSRDQEKDMTPTERATYMNNLSNRLSEVGDREGALKAIREAVEIRRGLPEENKTAINPGLAGSLNNLSGCLFGVGDRGGALDAAREAVGIYRGLVEGNAEVFKSDLAMSLSNLSNRLSEVGDHEGALKAIREAVEIRCGLAEGNTAAFNPDLAGSLSNLSNRLFGVGDRGGALDAAREAVGIYRGLAEGNAEVFKSDLAASLSNLSNRLFEVGDRGGALKAIREAVGIYRRLADGNVKAFKPDLARSLNNLSIVLSGVGDRGGALDVIWEAVGIYRGLAEGNVKAFKPDLAMSLSNLSNRLSEMGDRGGALKAVREATKIYHGLVEGNAEAFIPVLARSLNDLSSRLSDLGDRGGALKAVREAVGIYRGLAEGNVEAFKPDLARSLNNLSIVLSGVGDREGALDAAREAVEIRRGLAAENAAAFTPVLASSLNDLSVILSDLGDREGALDAAREAVGIYRGLVEGNAEAFIPVLAGSLSNLSNRLSDLGDRGGALDAAREAVRIYRGLVKESPAAFNPNLGMSLNNLSNRLSEVGDREGALEVIREAVGIYRGLAEGNAAAFKSVLAGSLSNLSNRLSEVGDRGGALKAVREAVGIYRGLAKESPAAFSSELARSLSNLSNRLSEMGDRGGALEVIREAVEIRRGLAKRNAAAFEADLIRSLNILACLLTEAGETDEALRCFTDFPAGLQARLWLARAHWQGQAGGVDDLSRAAELADAQDDPRLLGRVRRAIAETAGEWQAAIPTEQWEELPDWAVCNLNERLETLQAWIQCTNWDDQAQLLRSAWPAPTEDDVALARAAAERYVDVPGISTLADFVDAIAEQGLEPVLSEMQALHESTALVIGWRTAHAERKGRQYLKKHQNMMGNPRCREVLQRLGLPDEERESRLALLDLAAVSSADIAYDVAEDLEDADDAIRDFIDAANVPGMHYVLRVRPDLTEATPHGRFAAALCAYLTGHPEEGKRYLDLIGTTANPDDRESFRRCVHTLGRDPDYTDALAPVAEWLRTG